MVTDNKYPFVSKAEVRRRLEHEAAFVTECLALMQARHELRTSGAMTDGPCGWMASQRTTATALAMKAASGRMTAAETVEAAKLLQGYAKQIAVVLRARAVAVDPSLADAARVFGVLPPRGAGSKRPAEPPGAGGAPVAAEPATPEPAVGQQTDRESEPDGDEHDGELELRDLVLSHLSTAPGLRSEEIAKATGVTTAMIAPVLRDLVKAGRVRSTGVGRGTRYSTC